jgi:hypothetical protein
MTPRRRRHAATLMILATLLSPAGAHAQTSRNGSVGDRLAGLRVGHWIQLEGMTRASRPVACSEVRPLAGDFLDDDYSVKGLVGSVDPARLEFTIGGSRVRLTRSTTYDSPRGTLRGIAELHAGMILDVEGTLLKDGPLLAAEVDDESDEIATNPQVRSEIEVTGKIERIDLRRQVVTVMGIEFQVTPRTRLLSAIR